MFFLECLYLISYKRADLGPYILGYMTSGRYMMVGGRKGHLAMIDMISMDLIKEFQVCHDLFSLNIYGLYKKIMCKYYLYTCEN